MYVRTRATAKSNSPVFTKLIPIAIVVTIDSKNNFLDMFANSDTLLTSSLQIKIRKKIPKNCA